jgi:hypothetical protein
MSVRRVLNTLASATMVLALLHALPACTSDDDDDDDSAADDDDTVDPFAGFTPFASSDDPSGDAGAYTVDIQQGYHRVDGERIEFIVVPYSSVAWTDVDTSVWIVATDFSEAMTLTSAMGEQELWKLQGSTWSIDSTPPASFGVDISSETQLRFQVDYADIELYAGMRYGIGITAGSMGTANYHDEMPDGLIGDYETIDATLVPAN